MNTSIFVIDTIKEPYYGPYFYVRLCLKHPKLGVLLIDQEGLLTLPSKACDINKEPEQVAQEMALEYFQIDAKFTKDDIIAKIRWQDIKFLDRCIYTVVFFLACDTKERFDPINQCNSEWFSSMDQMNIDGAIRPVLFQLHMGVQEVNYNILTKIYP